MSEETAGYNGENEYEYLKNVEGIILEAIGSRSPEDTRQWIQWNIFLNLVLP